MNTYYQIVLQHQARNRPAERSAATYALCDTAIERAKKITTPTGAVMVVRVEPQTRGEVRTIRAFIVNGRASWAIDCWECNGTGLDVFATSKACAVCKGYGGLVEENDGPITQRGT